MLDRMEVANHRWTSLPSAVIYSDDGPVVVTAQSTHRRIVGASLPIRQLGRPGLGSRVIANALVDTTNRS